MKKPKRFIAFLLMMMFLLGGCGGEGRERDMELYELSEKVRKALKEKPYLPELIKYVLELDEQQIEQMIEISKNVKAA